MKLIFATNNQDKMKEIREILEGTKFEPMSMKEAGIDSNPVETGNTFAENALIKAREVWRQTGGLVIADDSGLCVDYLGGEPGIYSARYLGEDTSYDIKNAAIISRLQFAKDSERTARFSCAIAAILPDGREKVTEADVEGMIGYAAAGENGFGYDPIFYLPEYGMTSAELSAEEKNRISHRGKAMRAMRDELLSELG